MSRPQSGSISVLHPSVELTAMNGRCLRFDMLIYGVQAKPDEVVFCVYKLSIRAQLSNLVRSIDMAKSEE